MFPMITASALAQCITHLEQLLQDNSPEPADNAWHRCYQGIKAIKGNLDSYLANIVTAECFLHFFAENINSMNLCLARLQAEKEGRYADRLEDIVFELTEEMAVLMREHCLRTGFARLSADERELMDFFESSGHWFLGDGTMVSEYYFVTLPTRVISDCIYRLEKDVFLSHPVDKTDN